jgi:hypothetical protein
MVPGLEDRMVPGLQKILIVRERNKRMESESFIIIRLDEMWIEMFMDTVYRNQHHKSETGDRAAITSS